jgi:hypothetical protein
MNAYTLGTQIRLSATFTDANAAAADPTTVTCEVQRRPDADGTVYSYPAQITKTGTGAYYVDIVPTEGIWDYRWVGTGAVVAASEGSFNVEDSRFL